MADAAMHWLDPLLVWLSAHAYWAGAIVGLVAFSESLAVVGLVVPGAAVMFAVGALVGTGHLEFWVAFTWATSGAIAGDVLSFWLGRRYGARLRAVWPLSRYPGAFDRGVDFFRRHGVKSILIGRFVGPVRPIIPAVAGMMGMGVLPFLVVNVVSGVLWAPAYLLPGMAFAASLAMAASVATRLVTLVVGVAAAAWLLWRTSIAVRRGLGRRAGWAARRIHAPAGRPLRKALSALRHRAGLVWWLSVIVFLSTTALVSLTARPAGWEQNVLALMGRARTEHGRLAAWALTQLGGVASVLIAGAGMSIVLWMGQRRRLAAGVAVAVAVTLALGYGFKSVFAVDRPAGLTGEVFGAAFPSGHTVGISVLVFGLAAVLAPPGSRRRGTVYTVAGIVVGLVAGTRLYLGVHWPLDVIGGVTLGVIGVGVIALARDGAPSAALCRRLLVVAPAALFAGAVCQGTWDLQQGLTRYPMVPVWPVLDDDLSCTMVKAKTAVTGTAVWRGRENALDAHLPSGWQTASSWTLQNALRWISPDPHLEQLPPLPRLRSGRLPGHVWLRRMDATTRQLLRIWPIAGVKGTDERWWRIEVSREHVSPSWPVARARSRPEALPLDALMAAGRVCRQS